MTALLRFAAIALCLAATTGCPIVDYAVRFSPTTGPGTAPAGASPSPSSPSPTPSPAVSVSPGIGTM